MPRKAPKEVIEHRVTFGDYERNELRQLINAYQGDKIAENVPNFIIGGAAVIGAGALGLAAYAFWRWCDLGLLKDVIEDAWETTKNASLDLASSIGLGPDFITRVRLDLTSLKTEQEILDYINPLIAKVEADIFRLENMPEGAMNLTGGLGTNLIESRKRTLSLLIGARDFALMQVTSKGGAPTWQAKYGLGLLLQFQYQEWEKANSATLPPITDSAIGGVNEANREIWKDSFTVWMNNFVGNYNAANTDKELKYEPPTGYSENNFLIIRGTLFELVANVDTTPFD